MNPILTTIITGVCSVVVAIITSSWFAEKMTKDDRIDELAKDIKDNSMDKLFQGLTKTSPEESVPASRLFTQHPGDDAPSEGQGPLSALQALPYG